MTLTAARNGSDEISISLGFLNDLADATSLQNLYDIVTAGLPPILKCDRISLALPAGPDHMRIISVGGRQIVSRDGPAPMHRTGVGACFRTRKPVWIRDSFATDTPDFDLAPIRARGMRSVVFAPLLVAGDCYGTLNISDNVPDRFTDADIERIATLAAWIAGQIRHHDTLLRLTASESRLEAMIDHADAQIFAKTRDGEILIVNERYCTDHGVTRGAVVGRRDREIFGADHVDRWRASDEKVFETGGPIRTEGMAKGRDGRPRHYTVSKFTIFDPVRQEDIICAISTDLTAIRAMETDLSAANTAAADARDRLRLTQASVDFAAESVLWIDPDGAVRYANESACHLLGYGAEEILLARLFDFDTKATPETWPGILRLIRRPRGVAFTSEFRTRSGAPIQVAATARYVETGSLATICVFFHDISAQLSAQAALAESERRFRTFFDHSPSVMYIKDAHHRLSFVNKRFLEFHGGTEAEVIGRQSARRMPEDQRRAIDEFDERVMREGLATNTEMSVTSGDGTPGSFIVTKFPVHDSNGNVCGIGGISTDVTELRDREEQLRHARDEAEMAARLFEKEANKATAADRAKSEFLATMSHEIRTPLNGVLGMAGLLLDSDLSPDQRGKLATIRDSGATLLAILNDILDLSKIDSDRLEIDAADFSLGALLGSVERLWAPQARAKGLGWTCRLENDTAPVLRSDPGRIRQVLGNLLSNAVKFTDRGAICLAIGQSARADGLVETRFEVRDTGPGIDPEVRERLFQRFTQADSSVARRYGGTGLGLAISRSLAHLLGGDIEVDSAPGEGSLFRFTLICPAGDPGLAAAGDDAPSAAAAPAERPAKPRSLHILVAEDNPVNQKVITLILEQAGHRIDLAANGVEAVEAVKATSYDIVLMDIQMPEMDGMTATREIRALPGARAQVPIVAVTANTMKGDLDRYLEAGMNDYVPKPIDTARLARAIGRQTASYADGDAGAGMDTGMDGGMNGGDDIAGLVRVPAARAAPALSDADAAELDDLLGTFDEIATGS